MDARGFVVGKVPVSIEHLDLEITATFASGVTCQRAITITADYVTIRPRAPCPHAGPTRLHMIAALRPSPTDLDRIARLLD